MIPVSLPKKEKHVNSNMILRTDRSCDIPIWQTPEACHNLENSNPSYLNSRARFPNEMYLVNVIKQSLALQRATI